MSFSQRTVLVAAASCAATLAFVTTVNLSCGNVVPRACADQCTDLAPLQDRMAATETKLAGLEAKLAGLEAKLAGLQPVVLLARLTSDQAIPTSADTTVAVTADVDTHGALNAAHEYVVPLAGKYLITATLSYAGMDKARANNEIWITKPNMAPVRQNVVTAPGSAGVAGPGLRINSATVVQLDQGDHIALKAFHDYGVDRSVVSDAATPGRVETNLQVIRIGDVN
jgi:hypothetical protein